MRRRAWIGIVALSALGSPDAHGAPAVTGFTPTRGEPGTQVVVTGSGFTSALRVLFHTNAADFVVLAPGMLRATVPPEATTGPVRVEDTSGNGGTSAGLFVPSPRISGFTPERGAVQTGVVIDGFNFTGATNVVIAGARAGFYVSTDQQIRAQVPSGATNGPVVVHTPAGTARSSGGFTVIGPAPILDAFTPGLGAPGTAVALLGANFTNLLSVKFGGAPAAAPNAPTPSQINAVVPTGAVTGPLVVTTSTGSTTSSTPFVVTLAPVVTSFSPRQGKPGQTRVEITGINFTGITGVGFSHVPVTGWDSPVPGQLEVTVPAGAVTGRISVTNAHGRGLSAADFEITQAPVIESFDPELGAVGTPVTVRGFNLSNGLTTLRFNGVVTPFRVTGQTPEAISANVPSGATTGPLSLSNAAGVFVTPQPFTVLGDQPLVLALRPDYGPRGSQISVEGRNFFSPATVAFTGGTVSNLFAASPAEILVTVPPGAVSGPVVVSTPYGTSTNPVFFHAPPRLDRLEPAAAAPGAAVRLAGLNFTNATGVFFNEAAADFTVQGNTGMVAVVPAQTLGGVVRVTTPGGTVLSTNRFAVVPRVDSLTPGIGPVGAPVVVRGAAFRGVHSVRFGSVEAVFTHVSDTEIQAGVPPGAATAPVTVTTPEGSGASPQAFVVTQASDLQLALTAAGAAVSPGTPVLLGLTVTNQGPSTVTGARVSHRLPAGWSFVGATNPFGACVESNGVVRCDLGLLTNHTAVALSLTARPSTEGSAVHEATVSAVEADYNVGDNTAQVTVTVLTDASRTLTLQPVDPLRVRVAWPDSPVTLTLESTGRLPATTWQSETSPPSVSNGYRVVTNSIRGERLFYRLRLP